MLKQMYNFYPKKLVRPPGRTPKILLLVVKLTTILLTVVIIQASARSFAQKVTLNEKNAPLDHVFDEISQQTGYDFLISTENLKRSKAVNIHVQSEELLTVLNGIFSEQPLTFVIQEKIVVVSALAQPKPVKTEKANLIRVTGKVVDTSDRSLPGAVLKVKGSNRVSSCDAEGNFVIEAQDGDDIQVTFIGYEPVTFRVSNGMTLQKIVLRQSHSKLDEVQVIGYGTTTKRLNTGSVGGITATEIEKQPISDPLAALQGRMPGVFVQTTNGLPDGNIKIQIRGQGSIASGTDPLYIVDGVPFLSAPLYTGSPVGSNGVIGPFNVMNPGDIASIEVLKDADATAIYGSRGANGVILITTKKGKAGKDDFTVNIYQGFSRLSRYNEFLNLQQYLQLRREAFANDNVKPTTTNAPDLLVWDTTRSTNWQKYFLGGTAPVTNIQSCLSGGDANTRYLVSGHYSDEGTIFPGSEDYKKGGAYLNIEHTNQNKKFSSSFGLNYNKDDNHTLYATNTSVATLPPDFPIYNPDGSFNWTISNPVAALQRKQESQAAYLNINTVFSYLIAKGLDGKVSMGYNTYSLNQTATIPASSLNPASSPLSSALISTNSSERYILEPQVDYKRDLAQGKLTALLGGTYQSVLNQGTFLTASDVSNPDLLGNIGAATSITTKSNSYSLYKFGSVFGRVNYDWQHKYILDLNARRDGSSRFGPGHQFGNFGAVGAAWIFSEEPFIKNDLKWLSFGKLRGSYGTTGNDQIADYQYLPTYGSGATYGTVSTLSPSKIANPDYSWETTDKLELAAELSFLRDRILLTTAWYRDISGNQLISYTIPYTTGFASYQANFPAEIRNTGLEIEVNTQPVKGAIFNWHLDLNITVPKNELVAFPGIEATSYASSYIVGQDLNLVRSFQFTGVDPKTGLAIFKDINNDGVISYPNDVITAGKTSPVFFGGFNNTISYKSLQLDVFFEFTKRSYPGYTPVLGSSPVNDPVFVLNRWEKPGDITNVPRATLDASDNLSNYYASQFSDASYIRLKNIALTYEFKPSVLKTLGLKNLKIYIQGENLFVIANQNRLDPEISSSTAAFAPLRRLAGGIKFTF